MEFEAALLLVGTFLVLAIAFWRAAEHPRGTGREPRASQASELHKV